MRAPSMIAAVAIWACVLAASTSGQPILDRVEQFVRQQVGDAPIPDPPPSASEPGYLGIVADDRLDQGQGVRIISLTPGGPASAGGLLKGDLITSIDGLDVRVMDDVARALDGKTVGTPVAITVNRVGVSRQLEVTLGRRAESRVVAPPSAKAPVPTIPGEGVVSPPRPRLGVRTLPVTEEVRQQNNLPSALGATVISVTAGSPADRAGIPLGSVIAAVDNQAVDTPHALAAAIAGAGNHVQLSFVQGGLLHQRQVALDPPAGTSEPTLELRGRPVDAPEKPAPSDAPTPAEPAPADAARIAALEARIVELEARLEKLEAAKDARPEVEQQPNP